MPPTGHKTCFNNTCDMFNNRGHWYSNKPKQPIRQYGRKSKEPAKGRNSKEPTKGKSNEPTKGRNSNRQIRKYGPKSDEPTEGAKGRYSKAREGGPDPIEGFGKAFEKTVREGSNFDDNFPDEMVEQGVKKSLEPMSK